MSTYNGYKSYDHWNTALWIGNDEELYNLLANKVELAVYGAYTKQGAVRAILSELPNRTPDGAEWQVSTLLDLVNEEYNEQVQYS